MGFQTKLSIRLSEMRLRLDNSFISWLTFSSDLSLDQIGWSGTLMFFRS